MTHKDDEALLKTLQDWARTLKGYVQQGTAPFGHTPRIATKTMEAVNTLEETYDRFTRYRKAYYEVEDGVCQTLGKALGYPWYKDDQKNFPGATEEHGVCVGEHVAESIAMEAAKEIQRFQQVLGDRHSCGTCGILECCPAPRCAFFETHCKGDLAQQLKDALEDVENWKQRYFELCTKCQETK